MAIRVVIADDHLPLRAGIAALLRDLPEVEVVGEAATGTEALRLVDRLRPNVLLLDVRMPEMSGIDVLARLQEMRVATRIFMLSMYPVDELELRALSLGAAGYLAKDMAPDELRQALTAAVSSTIRNRGGTPDGVSAEPLTLRQLQVLKLIANGFSTKEMGIALNLSVKTVETYRGQIMDRLGIRDIAGLVRYAVRNGIVPP